MQTVALLGHRPVRDSTKAQAIRLVASVGQLSRTLPRAPATLPAAVGVTSAPAKGSRRTVSRTQRWTQLLTILRSRRLTCRECHAFL